MRVTVVGSGASTGITDGASSGYLLTSGHAALLLDCGPGIATRFKWYVAPNDVGAVVISHMHFDNFYDLPVLAIALYNSLSNPFMWGYTDASPPHSRAKLAVYLPPGGAEIIAGIAAAVGSASPVTPAILDAVLDIHEYDPDESFVVGPFTVRMIGPVAHGPGRCFGMRVADAHATVAYSGESAACDALDEIARDADLFLCDAMGPSRQMQTPHRTRHLTADEAGEIAARMGAKHLVLTHVMSYSPTWQDAILAAARSRYDGPVSVACEGSVFDFTNPLIER